MLEKLQDLQTSELYSHSIALKYPIQLNNHLSRLLFNLFKQVSNYDDEFIVHCKPDTQIFCSFTVPIQLANRTKLNIQTEISVFQII